MLAAQDIGRDKLSVAIFDPFFIFEVHDLFDRDTYDQLDSQFPEKPMFPAVWHDRGGKYHMNSKMPEFDRFLDRAPIWRQLYGRLSDPLVVERLYQLARAVPSERPARETKPWRLDSRAEPNGFARKAVTQLRRLTGSVAGYTPVRLTFEFSYLESNCYIPPHTDVPGKLISLMIYFPDAGVQYPPGAGTEFYRGKDQSAAQDAWRVGMLEDEAMKTFFDRHEVFYTSEFTPNKLVGFVKSSNSWHGVRPLTLPANATRRSLNINYYLA